MEPRRAAFTIAGFTAVFVAVLCTVALAPAYVSLALAATVSTAWGVWLEKHPGSGPGCLSVLLALAITPVGAAQTSQPWRNVKFGPTLEGYEQYDWIIRRDTNPCSTSSSSSLPSRSSPSASATSPSAIG